MYVADTHIWPCICRMGDLIIFSTKKQKSWICLRKINWQQHTGKDRETEKRYCKKLQKQIALYIIDVQQTFFDFLPGEELNSKATKNPILLRKPHFNIFLLHSKEYVHTHVNNSGKSWFFFYNFHKDY